MGNRRPLTIVLTSPDEDRIGSELATRPEITVESLAHCSGAELLRAAQRADVLITRAVQPLDRAVFGAGAGRLKAVIQPSAGSDNIDFAAALEAGVAIVLPDPGNAVAVAEWTLLHLLALVRGVRRHWEGRTWDWGLRETLEDRELCGLSLGVIGVGRCGSRVARRAVACEMTTRGYDPYIPDQRFTALGVSRATELDQLLAVSEIVTLHCPLTAETRGMLGRRELAQLPRGAWVINAARGGLLDEEALVSALDEGRIAGAAIDVWSHEPRGRTGLALHPKVLATPHLAGHTAPSHRRRREHLLAALKDVIDRLQSEESNP